MYFLLAGMHERFHLLSYGLAIVLVFIGAKMLLTPHHEPAPWWQVRIPIGASLMVVASIILLSMLLSLVAARRERQTLNPGTHRGS
jgi:tellurite resistance protein TerC